MASNSNKLVTTEKRLSDCQFDQKPHDCNPCVDSYHKHFLSETLIIYSSVSKKKDDSSKEDVEIMSPEKKGECYVLEHVIKEVPSPCLIDYHVLSVHLVCKVCVVSLGIVKCKFVVTSKS